MNNQSSVDLFELDTNGKALLEQAFEKLNVFFSEKKQAEALARLEKWKTEGVYPFAEKNDLGVIETARREIFDIIATKVEENLPKFDKVDQKTKKLTFQLLSQALQDNPASMQKIINEVLNLKEEEKDDFAKLLDKSSLSSVIKSSKVVAERLEFLEGLSKLIFEHKKELLERDQLHKILENEAWIFDEHFALAGSEKRLEEALNIHLDILGERMDRDADKTPVLINDERQGRVDLMLSKSIEIRPGYKDFLIVELKRPSKKIDNEVMGQLKGYAQAVRDDERFDKNKCTWKFIAVSNEFDKIAEMSASETGKPRGCILQVEGLEIYIMKWSELITNAKSRLKFYQDQLQYEASEESSIEYLQTMYSKFIPESVKTAKAS